MRLGFSREQIMFQGTARDIFQRHCPPAAVRAAWSAPTGRVPGLWTHLAEAGIVGLTTPDAHGGLGLGELDLVLVLEEAGRAAAPEPLLEAVAVGAPLLAEAGTPALREDWLARAAAGEALLTIGLAGASHVAFAAEADLLLLERDGALHALPRAAVRLTAAPSVDGSRRLASVEWTAAPGCARGPEAGRALARARDRGALAAAAELLGLGARMIEMTVEHVKVRRQFGQPIGSFQAVKHHLAGALVAVELSRPLVYRAAWSLSRADADASVHVSMAHAQAADAARVTARAALQCHGALGYTVEYDLHLWMKRVWALAAAWGGAGWHRERVARRVLDGGGA
jgi:alkylation response protein AidB-like acyl-CoA dehydrogenase